MPFLSQYPTGLTLDSPWPFKKHKDESVEFVIQHDPSYVCWCVQNTSLQLDNEAWEMLSEKVGGDPYEYSEA